LARARAKKGHGVVCRRDLLQDVQGGKNKRTSSQFRVSGRSVRCAVAVWYKGCMAGEENELRCRASAQASEKHKLT
jgi:hypothetical protein